MANRLQRLMQVRDQLLRPPFSTIRRTIGQQALAQLEAANGFPLAPQQREAVQTALTTQAVRADRRSRHRQDHDRAHHPAALRPRALPRAAGCPHRPRRQAPERDHRPRGQDAAPPARIQAGRGHGLSTARGESAGGRPGDRGRGVDARHGAHQPPAQGHPPRRAPAAGGRRRPTAQRRPRQCAGDIIDAIRRHGKDRCTALGSAAVVRLQTIFRQEAGSYIIANAHRINHGEMPVIDNDGARDFFLFKTEEPERAAQLCVELVTERIPRRFGIAARGYPGAQPHASRGDRRRRAQRAVAGRAQPARRQQAASAGSAAAPTAAATA